jgi:hypothetical protein
MSAPDPNRLGETLKRAADAATPRPVDVDAVLRASSARRRARRTALVGGVGAVAAALLIGGGVMAGLQGLGGPTAAEAPTAFESAELSTDAVEEGGDAGAADDLRFMAPEQVNRCGAPVAAPTDAAASPLSVTVEVPATLVRPGTTNPVTVTVTNTGTDVVSGSLGEFAPITVAESGITVWHSGPGEGSLRQVSLAPGESTVLEGSFETRFCAEADDLGGSLRAGLPGLEPGGYGVSAIVSFTSPDGVLTSLISPLAPLSVG